jgi:hypothetical protein
MRQPSPQGGGMRLAAVQPGLVHDVSTGRRIARGHPPAAGSIPDPAAEVTRRRCGTDIPTVRAVVGDQRPRARANARSRGVVASGDLAVQRSPPKVTPGPPSTYGQTAQHAIAGVKHLTELYHHRKPDAERDAAASHRRRWGCPRLPQPGDVDELGRVVLRTVTSHPAPYRHTPRSPLAEPTARAHRQQHHRGHDRADPAGSARRQPQGPQRRLHRRREGSLSEVAKRATGPPPGRGGESATRGWRSRFDPGRPHRTT